MFDRLREDINCVFERDPAARNTLEILTTSPGLYAIFFHRLNHRLWKLGLKWLARVISTLSRWLTGIEIHPGAVIGQRFFIDHGMGVVIGETAEVGDDCTLYHGVTLGGTSWQKGKRHPTLHNNVVVGAGAKILGPITVSEGARIGSNSVVLKDVPPNSTVVGVPGRVVKRQTTDTEQRRQQIASKMGFDAYGTTPDMPDPVAHAINLMLDHIHVLDAQVDSLSRTVEQLGGSIGAAERPELTECEIESAGGDDGAADLDGSRLRTDRDRK